MLSSSYKKKCINVHKKLTEPLQLSARLDILSVGGSVTGESI